MCLLIVLLLGLLTFVSGHPPPGQDTGCDVAVLRLEKMITDLTSRVLDLEIQRQADVMEIANLRQDMEKVKTENRQLKTELDLMVTTKCDQQLPSHATELSINETKINAKPKIIDLKTGTNRTCKELTVHEDDTGRTTKDNRIRRDDLHLSNRVVLDKTVAFFSTLNHVMSDVATEQIIQFENVVTNNGGHYNKQSGVFTCGTEGTYVFSWTLYVSTANYIDSELVKNGNSFAYSRAGDQNYNEASSTSAVVNLSPGDMVWTRVKSRSAGADIKPFVSMFGGFKI